MNKRGLILVAGVAIAFRLAFFALGLRLLPVSSDEAWPPLMAMHILRGDIPWVYWGQTYMGTQESFFDAALIPWLGATTATIRIYPLLFAFLFPCVTAALAFRIYDGRTALLTFALLAVPAPYLAMCGALVAPDNYLATTTLGSLSLLLTYDLALGPTPQRHRWKWLALGFLLGFGFWLHILNISYIGVAGLFLWLADKRLPLRPRTWMAAGLFALGSLPLWVFNLRNGFETFQDVGQTTSLLRSLNLLVATFQTTLPVLLGGRVMLYPDSHDTVHLPGPVSLTLLAIWGVLFGLVLVRHFRALLCLGRRPLTGSDGTPLLIAATAASLFVFCRSTRSASLNVRYLLPVMSALPILLAHGLMLVRSHTRSLFWALLVFVLGTQAWGNVVLVQQWRNPQGVSRDLELPDTRQLIRFLDDHGIRHAYAHFWLSYRLTFETGERILCAEPYNERFPGRPVKYLDQVADADNVAYIEHPTLKFARDFESLLREAGGQYQKAQVGVFTVYYGFVPPSYFVRDAKHSLHELPRRHWQVTASRGRTLIPLLLDGSIRTRWCTHSPQEPGDFIQVDMQSTQLLSRVTMQCGAWATDYPRGYEVRTSLDGREWCLADTRGDDAGRLYWDGSHPHVFAGGNDRVETFAPVTSRYFRLVLTDSHPRYDWSVAELKAYAARP